MQHINYWFFTCLVVLASPQAAMAEQAVSEDGAPLS